MAGVKWWHFWNPMSGLFGGVIAGVVFFGLLLIVLWVAS